MTLLLPLVLALPLVAAPASDPTAITGDYVETRTAQIFAGGCIMGSEGETSGREAVMGWRVSRGTLNGVRLDGLSVVAAIAADMNLGTHELGGATPTILKSIIMVDSRADARQREALVGLVKGLAPNVIAGEIDIQATAIDFRRDNDSVHLAAGNARMEVGTKVEHTAACAAIKWFEPLAKTDRAAIGITRLQEWRGEGLRGAQWHEVSDDKKASFFGTFTYRGQ